MPSLADSLFIILICGVIWGAIYLSRRSRKS